ncbi:MAG: Holliday junction branch migration protein RuvA, partial [Erysipelotrichaceae bacterium]|nr:Holliday junction branch migration protein RuvA [Erysipelotrichaceae bacterium]
EEYDLFIKLISVKGLGPKIASNILSRASVDAIITAVETGDIDFIRHMPGIGNKTASQIILDLKGKLVESSNETNNSEELNDVSLALKQFGYKPAEIKPVMKKLAKEHGSTDELIKKALSMLMK